jgi:hypothetical protein
MVNLYVGVLLTQEEVIRILRTEQKYLGLPAVDCQDFEVYYQDNGLPFLKVDENGKEKIDMMLKHPLELIVSMVEYCMGEEWKFFIGTVVYVDEYKIDVESQKSILNKHIPINKLLEIDVQMVAYPFEPMYSNGYAIDDEEICILDKLNIEVVFTVDQMNNPPKRVHVA